MEEDREYREGMPVGYPNYGGVATPEVFTGFLSYNVENWVQPIRLPDTIGLIKALTETTEKTGMINIHIHMASFKNSRTFCVLNSIVILFLKTAKTSIIYRFTTM
jgi:hypothetical protein